MLLPAYKAARKIGVGIRFLYRAIREGALPADAVIRVGPKKVLINLNRWEDIVKALAVWSQQAAKPDNDREARIRRVVGGVE
jgi:hypothetical protein